MVRLRLIILVTILWNSSAISQSAINLQISTVSYNFAGNKYPEEIRFKLNDSGNITYEPGLIIGYESFFSDLPLSFRITQGIGLNSYGKFTGNTQLRLFISVFRQWKSALNISGGTVFYFREKNTSIMDNDNDFDVLSEMFEFSLYPISAGIEYNYSLNKNIDLSLSLNHYYKFNLQFMAGVRWWLSKNKKRKYRCLTCPDFS